jgi:rubredoxin
MEMKKYRCSLCGYVYNPAIADTGKGIAPGTPFEELPEDWCCPVCGAGKEHFGVILEL